MKLWWLPILLVLPILCIVSAHLYATRPPRLEIIVHPDPPIHVKPGYYIDFDVYLKNHGGKAKGVEANVTFPKGFITHKHRDAVQGALQLHYGTVHGGGGTRIGKHVAAPDEPGNYTGNVIIWGANAPRQTRSFTVMVGTQDQD